jgi:hypothetical protein
VVRGEVAVGHEALLDAVGGGRGRGRRADAGGRQGDDAGHGDGGGGGADALRGAADGARGGAVLAG